MQAQEGRSLFDHDNPAMDAILKAHPYRVALTRPGRVEVHQMIGGPDTGGTSPEGPHTQVLSKRLQANRTHSANAPTPKGWVPCCGFHPKSPVNGRLGEDKTFDREAFDRLQALVTDWGITEYTGQKRGVLCALDTCQTLEAREEPITRMARAGLRNAIRQWRQQRGDRDLVAELARVFDRGEADADPENPGH